MRTGPIALAAALALAGCQGSSPGAAPAGAPRTPVVATGTLQVLDAGGNAGPLRLADVPRLTLASTYQGDPGVHAVRIDAFAPSGILHVQLKAPLDAGATGAGSASQGLEVEGTPIDAYHMVGTWRFVLHVDGSPLASASVDLTD